MISAPNASDANAATYTLNTSPYSPILADNIVFSDGVVKIDGLVGQYGSDVLSFTYDGQDLYLYGRGGTVAEVPFLDQSPDQGTHLEVSMLGSSFYVTEGTLHEPAGAALVNGGAVPPTPPASTGSTGTAGSTTPPPPPPGITRDGYATIYDTTTQAYINDSYSHPYMGPVAGLQYDCEPITPDSLNITARENNMFIKTSSGNDAIALLGGTNVVDAGTGSNFLTSGGGFDTFFLDARNIPAASSAAGPVPGAIWDTVQGFGHGDAVTLFGIGPGTALDWQKNQGAVGHAGLTLHANLANGGEASLTLAGIDSKANVALSYGSTGGASYLYVKAV